MNFFKTDEPFLKFDELFLKNEWNFFEINELF